MAETITLKGSAEIRNVRELLESGKPLVIPSGAELIAERAAVMRLAKKGVVELDTAAGTYWLKSGVKVQLQRTLHEALKEGPIRSLEWHRYASSRASFHVLLTRLRKRGKIKARRDLEAKRGSGRPAMIYELAR